MNQTGAVSHEPGIQYNDLLRTLRLFRTAAIFRAGARPDPRSVPGTGERAPAAPERRCGLLLHCAGSRRAGSACRIFRRKRGAGFPYRSGILFFRLDPADRTLQIVCYGPHALSNARKIRAFLYVDGPGFPRSILRKAGLYPVPDPPEPMLLHEPEGSLWRTRADLTVSLRAEEKETHPVRRGAVTVPPAVIIHN